MRKLFLFLALFLSVNLFAQDDFKNRFEEASVLMEDNWYSLALPIWIKLLEQQPENNNVNYKIGICYYNRPTEEVKGLPYLRKAVKGINKNYDPFSPSESGCNPDALFYLAHLYHIEYELDSAINYFNQFIELVNKNHILTSDAKRQIEQCNNAKIQVQNPVNVKIKNLGITINSAYSEHSPVVSLDETEIVFTSRRLRKDSANIKYKDSRDGQYYEDVYIAYKDDNGQWSDPELINIDRVNHHLASIGLSPDNQTLYVYHDEDGNGNIYQSSLLTDKKWSNPEQVSKEIDSQANEDHLSISVDGNTMFFTSDRKGGLGGTDIYVCRKLADGEWSKAQNVGAPINTPYNEESPFFHPDGITLHFSSEGHSSMGGFDIFVTQLQDDETWSNPINIGYPINTTHDDITYVTSPDGKRGYFSSYGGDDSFGDMDLYVVLQDDAVEKELTLLKGFINVTNGDTMPQNIAINLSDNETGKLIAKTQPSQRNGSFVFIIPPGENYNISYEISGKNFYNETIYVPRGAQYQEIEKEILLDPIALTAKSIDKETKQDKVAKVQTIGSDIPEETIMDKLSYQEFFTYNTNYPKKEKELQKFIEKIAEQIKTTGSIKISIESSASRVPTKTYNSNDQLSKLRSEIAKKMLLQKLAQIGIEEDKVIFINLTSLVQGPSYKGDYLENKIMYEKYQYVKIYSE